MGARSRWGLLSLYSPIQIYAACLASYNNGILYGEWITVTQNESEIMADNQNMLKNSPIDGAEEFAIHAYEEFESLCLGEYESIATFVAYAEFIVEHGDLGQVLLADCGFEEAKIMICDGYQSGFDSEVDFSWHVFEECYNNKVPDNFMYYCDYEAFARDLSINEYCSLEVNGMSHIFSRY